MGTHTHIYICVCVWLGCIMWIWVHHRGTHNHEESPLRDHVVVWQIIPLVKVYAVYAITNHTCGIKFHIPGGKGVNNHMLPPHSPHIYILHIYIYIYNYCYLSIYSPYIYMCVYIYICVCGRAIYCVCMIYLHMRTYYAHGLHTTVIQAGKNMWAHQSVHRCDPKLEVLSISHQLAGLWFQVNHPTFEALQTCMRPRQVPTSKNLSPRKNKNSDGSRRAKQRVSLGMPHLLQLVLCG